MSDLRDSLVCTFSVAATDRNVSVLVANNRPLKYVIGDPDEWTRRIWHDAQHRGLSGIMFEDYTGWFIRRSPRINNCRSRNNLQMKTKFGEYIPW
jgi:hypothetical protein